MELLAIKDWRISAVLQSMPSMSFPLLVFSFISKFSSSIKLSKFINVPMPSSMSISKLWTGN